MKKHKIKPSKCERETAKAAGSSNIMRNIHKARAEQVSNPEAALEKFHNLGTPLPKPNIR